MTTSYPYMWMSWIYYSNTYFLIVTSLLLVVSFLSFRCSDLSGSCMRAARRIRAQQLSSCSVWFSCCPLCRTLQPAPHRVPRRCSHRRQPSRVKAERPLYTRIATASSSRACASRCYSSSRSVSSPNASSAAPTLRPRPPRRPRLSLRRRRAQRT